MNVMEKFCRVIALVLLVSFVSCTSTPYAVNLTQLSRMQAGGKSTSQTSRPSRPPPAAPTASPYWTGDGCKGKSITILPPKGSGLAENQAYLPDFVANELLSNFSGYSAMTLFDRVNNQRQYDELLSGYYADDDKAGMDLGHSISTDYMLLGTITKTSTGYALQLTVNSNSYNRKETLVSYSGAVSIAELDNLTGVRKASLYLLEKMGVQVTAKAREELTKAATVDRVNAQTALAQGLTAQRQGTEVAALSYFFQAEAFDASLTEAVGRTNVLSTNISTGNIGANARNDVAWFNDWQKKLTETETLMNDMLKNTNPQRSVWYSNNVTEYESARDVRRETTELRIEAVLHTHAAFPVSVQRTVQAVYDGLQTTGRTQAWKLDSWPRQGVTNSNPFNSRWGSAIPVAFEVLNEQNKVIGRQTVEMDSRFNYNGTRLDGPATAFATVRFTGVNINDITDRLSIRIATINGRAPESAGISRIEPMPGSQIEANKSFAIYNGVLRPSSNSRDLGAVVMPAELWGERVTAAAFENRGITRVTIPEGVTAIPDNAFAKNKLSHVTIPGSVATIGDSAFADNRLESIRFNEGLITIGAKAFAGNHWTTTGRNQDGSTYTIHNGLKEVNIPDSVTSIGDEAFASHWRTTDGNGSPVDNYLLTEISVGANVSFGKNAVGNGFEAFYAKENRQAGIYRTRSASPGILFVGGWERFGDVGARDKKDKARRGGMIVLGVLAVGGLITWLIIKPKDDGR